MVALAGADGSCLGLISPDLLLIRVGSQVSQPLLCPSQQHRVITIRQLQHSSTTLLTPTTNRGADRGSGGVVVDVVVVVVVGGYTAS